MEHDIRGWLASLGLDVYADAFEANCIDAEVLPDLTSEDLKEIGVLPVGHRRKLLSAIAALRAETHDDAPSESGPSASVQEQNREGERRQVTVLFADLCGFTQLSSQIDPEELHALLASYFERLDSIIHDYGGTVDKHIGDSVMAVFGAPVSHGNDAERAVRAALAIQAAMPDLTARLGHRLQSHIGVTSGQVVASGIGADTHYTVVGDSVNLAARLTDAAGPGEIFISSSVEQAMSGSLATADLGQIAIKGLAEPVRAYAVQAGQAAKTASEESPFVGRQAETRQFIGALQACLDVGTGQLLYIRGDAGIGKTRLTHEFCRLAAERQVTCHRSLVLDFGVGRGQDPVRMLVRSFLDIADGADDECRTAAAERAVAEGLVAGDHAVHLKDLLDLPQSAADQALYDAMDNPTRNAGKRATVAALACGLARRRPRLIVIEDLHWADEILLQHIAELGRSAAGCPLLIVMTSRVEGDPLDPGWRASLPGTPFITLDIGPLSQSDAMAIAARYGTSVDRFARSCIERAAGNPLFLEQLLRSAEERGEVEVPGSVQSIVQARLDNLPPSDKTAIQAASILGQRFALDALRHLIADERYECAQLLSHHLIRRQGEDFLFVHALVRDGVYGSLLRARRNALHLRAAEWFAARDLALRADHLERAGDPRAAEAYYDAAEAQTRALRLERARQLAERGLAVALEPSMVYALSCQLAELLRDLGEAERSIAAYEEAEAKAATNAERARAWLGIAEGMRIVERIDDALALLARTQPVAEEERLADVLMRLHHLRGNLLFPKGDIEGCEAEHRQSLAYAREIGSPEGEARGLGGLGDAAYVAGRMRTSDEELSRCVEICRRYGFGRVEVANASQICHTKIYQLHLHEARTLGARVIEAARLVGHDRAELNAQAACVFAAVEQGDWPGAGLHADRVGDLARRIGSIRFSNQVLAFRAVRLKALGDSEQALLSARQALANARDLGLSFGGPRILGILARISDDPEEQDRALAEAEQLIAGGCVGHNQLYFYRDAIDVALARRQWDRADRFADKLAAFSAAEPLPWSDYFSARGRALATWGRGALDAETLAELKRLRAQTERIGLPLALPGIDQALHAA
ncbi:MAG: adenylate/guanylate cyclase domain-containing protein [Geminicoccaceae bacterium]